jgi:hypothetical protein
LPSVSQWVWVFALMWGTGVGATDAVGVEVSVGTTATEVAGGVVPHSVSKRMPRHTMRGISRRVFIGVSPLLFTSSDSASRSTRLPEADRIKPASRRPALVPLYHDCRPLPSMRQNEPAAAARHTRCRSGPPSSDAGVGICQRSSSPVKGGGCSFGGVSCRVCKRYTLCTRAGHRLDAHAKVTRRNPDQILMFQPAGCTPMLCRCPRRLFPLAYRIYKPQLASGLAV